MGKISIAIDGPSGAGKSTLARMMAKHLGFIYVDTGALYRCVGLYMLRHGIGSKDAQKVLAHLSEVSVEMKYDSEGVQRMYLCSEDVTDDIRLPEVSIYASDVSAIPEVRSFLLDTQRNMAEKYDVIMDGRDIGTVVLPQAQIKIFLTASPEERARRRYKELTEKGIQTEYEEVLRDVIYRDRNDSTRAVAPLRPADDAILVDTTGNTLERSFEILKDLVEEGLKVENKFQP